MLNEATLQMLRQLAHGLCVHFGSNCEVVVHDLSRNQPDSSIVLIENGHVSSRKVGDGPSHIVLEALRADPAKLEDKLSYLTRTHDGRILKSSTIYIRDEEGSVSAIFAINYDITGLLAVEGSLHSLISTGSSGDLGDNEPESIPLNVNELLDELINQSIKLVGKPVAMMNKDDKIKAIQFLNNAGAFLITKSGDKVSKQFGISKYTLYNYMDASKAE
jgi:predicted transcriptional regulator YheO